MGFDSKSEFSNDVLSREEINIFKGGPTHPQRIDFISFYAIFTLEMNFYNVLVLVVWKSLYFQAVKLNSCVLASCYQDPAFGFKNELSAAMKHFGDSCLQSYIDNGDL